MNHELSGGLTCTSIEEDRGDLDEAHCCGCMQGSLSILKRVSRGEGSSVRTKEN
jgi:hypothetical protein